MVTPKLSSAQLTGQTQITKLRTKTRMSWRLKTPYPPITPTTTKLVPPFLSIPTFIETPTKKPPITPIPILFGEKLRPPKKKYKKKKRRKRGRERGILTPKATILEMTLTEATILGRATHPAITPARRRKYARRVRTRGAAFSYPTAQMLKQKKGGKKWDL